MRIMIAGGTGIGLTNIRNKLQSYYGSDAYCTWAADKSGFRGELRMPLQMA